MALHASGQGRALSVLERLCGQTWVRASPEMGQERRKSLVNPEPVSLPWSPQPAEHPHGLWARARSGPLGAALNRSAQQKVLSGMDCRQTPPRSAQTRGSTRRVPGSLAALLTRHRPCVSLGHTPPWGLLSGGGAPSGEEALGGLWHHLLRLPQRERPLPLPGQQQPLPLSGRGQERLHGEPWSLAGVGVGGWVASCPPEPGLCVPRCPP